MKTFNSVNGNNIVIPKRWPITKKAKVSYHPVSYGVILISKKEKRVLAIQRRNSLSFSDLILGYHKVLEKEEKTLYTIRMFQGMTPEERNDVKYLSLNELIDKYTTENEVKVRNNIIKNYKKFDFSWVNSIESNYTEPEFSFPKGRPEKGESGIDCAIREFEEETLISRDSISFLKETPFVFESFYGTNGKKYTCIYYIAYLKEEVQYRKSYNEKLFKREISSVNWFTNSEILDKLRVHDFTRKKLIEKVFRLYV